MKCSKPFLEVLRHLPDESTPKFVDLIKNWGGLDWQKLIRLKKVYLFVSGREKKKRVFDFENTI